MSKRRITPPVRFIPISEAETRYGLSDKTIRTRLRESHCRARVKVDKTVRYDTQSMDELLAGCVTIAELPLYKRFAEDHVAKAYYGIGHNKLVEIASECGGIIKHGKSVFYDLWAIDGYLEDLALW